MPRRPIDPAALFRQAEAFSAAAEALRPDPALALPYLANAAFALELHLKCLLLLRVGRYPQVHSLRALFGQLPAEEARRVRALHATLHAAHHPDPAGSRDGRRRAADAALDAILESAGDAFQVGRYAHELGAGSVPDVAPLAQAVRGRLLELRPDWASGAPGPADAR